MNSERKEKEIQSQPVKSALEIAEEYYGGKIQSFNLPVSSGKLPHLAKLATRPTTNTSETAPTVISTTKMNYLQKP